MSTIVGTPSEASDKIKITLEATETYTLDTLAGDDSVHIYGGGFLQLFTTTGNDWVSNMGTGRVEANLGGGNDYYQSVGLSAVDTVWAGGGDDVVELGKGNDWVKGGGGDDTLTGGSGADTFHYPFNSIMAKGRITDYWSVCEHDVITDFEAGTDILEFGPDFLSLTEFTTRFAADQQDFDGNGTLDTKLTLENDTTFSITLLDNTLTEHQIYNNTTWFTV